MLYVCRHGCNDAATDFCVGPRALVPPAHEGVSNVEKDQVRGEKKPARGGLHSVGWWRWRESNSRPEDLYSRDYMLSLVNWISSPRRRRTGCGMTSHLALALRPSDPGGRDRSKCPRRDLRCYPRITRAERHPVRGPAGLSRQSVAIVVRS